MTTLEETRAWMRAGCPVEEPRPESTRCSGAAGFRLYAWPDRRMLTAWCAYCGDHAGVEGPAGRDGTLVHLWPMVEVLGDWMDRHVGHDVGRSSGLLVRSNTGHERVEAWAVCLMAGRDNDGPDDLSIQNLDGRDYYILSQKPSYTGAGRARPEMLPMSPDLSR